MTHDCDAITCAAAKMADELFVNVFGSGRRTELKAEVNLSSMSVHDLKECVYKAVDVSKNEHVEEGVSETDCALEQAYIVYGGRVLRDSRGISDYGIKSGATLFVLKKKTTVTAANPPSEDASYAPDFVDLMQDDRVQNVVHQMVTNPSFLRAAMPHVAANPQFRRFLMLPEAVRNSDAQTLTRHLLGNPEMVAVGQMFMDTFFCTLTTEEDGEGEGASRVVSREEFIAHLIEEAAAEERMVEGYESGGEAEGNGDEMMEQVAESQQQMYERSQALAAHEQQQQEGSHLSSGDRQQRQHMVTPGDLSSALSSALRQAPPVPQPPPPTTHSSATPQSGTAISQDTLSTALAGVYWGSRGGQPPGQAQGAHPRGPTPSSAVPRSQREHYRQQLAQLRGMGIVDEAACVHALEATGGNVEAALEVLLGSGQ